MRLLRLLPFLLIALAFLACAASFAGASPGDQVWLHLVHAAEGKVVSDSWHEVVAVARTGDVYVAGSQTHPGSSEDEDFLVARYTTAGVFKWSRVFDHGAGEVVTDVAADRKGNVVLCGRVDAYAGFLVVKYSRAGDLQWVRRLRRRPGLDAAEEIAIDARGAIYVAGSHATSSASETDMCLVKYSPSGHLLWLRTYAKANITSELAMGPDGNLYVGGAEPTSEGDQVCIARYSPGGHRDWVRVVGTPRQVDDWIWDLDVRSSGVCATGQSSLDGSMESFVVRLALDGTVTYWHRIIGAENPGEASYEACGIDGLGRVSVAGWQGSDFAVRRYSPTGSPTDVALWHGGEDFQAVGQAAAVTPGGSVVATGFVNNTDTGQDMWTVELSPSWQTLFTVSHGSPTYGNDSAGDIALASGYAYVAGVSDGDLILIKYER